IRAHHLNSRAAREAITANNLAYNVNATTKNIILPPPRLPCHISGGVALFDSLADRQSSLRTTRTWHHIRPKCASLSPRELFRRQAKYCQCILCQNRLVLDNFSLCTSTNYHSTRKCAETL